MLRESSRGEVMGCVGGLLGGILGFVGGVWEWRNATAMALALDPDDPADYLPVMPLVLLVVGGLIGAVVGMVLSSVIRPRRPNA